MEKVFYVSTFGNDEYGDGSYGNPWATINKAKSYIREISDAMTGDIDICIKGGTYYLDKTIEFDERDSGKNGFNIKYCSCENETPVISGGQKIIDWTLYNSQKNIYRAFVGEKSFRQLYINGKRGIMARYPKRGAFFKVFDYDKMKQEIILDISEFRNLQNSVDTEMVLLTEWAENYLRIESYYIKDHKVHIIIKQPERDMLFKRAFPRLYDIASMENEDWIKDKQEYYLENAYEFLEDENEWYYDKNSKYLYFKPSENEDITRLDIIMPNLETLFKIEASSYENMVKSIVFSGLKFAHTTWNYPSYNGYIGLQAGMYAVKVFEGNIVYGGRPKAAVYIKGAKNIKFEENSFELLGSTGLDLHRGTKNNIVKGNVFKDLGGNGITIGIFSEEWENISVPFNPKDLRDRSINDEISNNYIEKIGQDNFGTCAISAGYVTNIKIVHNEMYDLPYTGISIGWGWTKEKSVMENNYIAYNKIIDFCKLMYDGGGIYTLSNQGNSVIENNYCKTSSCAKGYGYRTIYLDENSSNFTVQNNVVDIPNTNESIEWFYANNGAEGVVSNNFSNNSTQHIQYEIECKDNNFTDNVYLLDRVKNVLNNVGIEGQKV